MSDVIGSIINAITSAIDSIVSFIRVIVDRIIRQVIDTLQSVFSTIWNIVVQPITTVINWIISAVGTMVVQPARAILQSALSFIQRKMFGTLYIVLLVKLMERQVVGFVEKPSLGKLALIAAKPFLLYIALAIGWNVMMGFLSSMRLTGPVSPAPIQMTPPQPPGAPQIPVVPQPQVTTTSQSDVQETVISVEMGGVSVGQPVGALSDAQWTVISVEESDVSAPQPGPAADVRLSDVSETVISTDIAELAKLGLVSDKAGAQAQVEAKVGKPSSAQSFVHAPIEVMIAGLAPMRVERKVQTSASVDCTVELHESDLDETVIDVSMSQLARVEGELADFSSMPDWLERTSNCSEYSFRIENGMLRVSSRSTVECKSQVRIPSYVRDALKNRRIIVMGARFRGITASGNSHPWRADYCSLDGVNHETKMKADAGRIAIATWSSSTGQVERATVAASVSDNAVSVCIINASSKMCARVVVNATRSSVAAWGYKYTTLNSVENAAGVYIGPGVTTLTEGYIDDWFYASPE